MKLVIGLVGEKGSGKETFTRLLKEVVPDKKIAHIRFSDILRETLVAWDLPTTRENLQKIAVVMKNGFGPGTLSHAVYQKVSSFNADIVLLDGVRWESDEQLIRKFDKNLMIYITADLMLRYERLKIRKEKADEEDTSFEQFMREEKAENELLIPIIGKRANIKIENNSSLVEFKQKISEFISLKIK